MPDEKHTKMPTWGSKENQQCSIYKYKEYFPPIPLWLGKVARKGSYPDHHWQFNILMDAIFLRDVLGQTIPSNLTFLSKNMVGQNQIKTNNEWRGL